MGPVCLPKLPHDTKDYLPLALREAQRLASDIARRLVPEAHEELRVKLGRLLAVHKVGGLHAEDGRGSSHLPHLRVGDRVGPWVGDDVEEVPDPPGEVPALRSRGFDPRLLQ